MVKFRSIFPTDNTKISLINGNVVGLGKADLSPTWKWKTCSSCEWARSSYFLVDL